MTVRRWLARHPKKMTALAVLVIGPLAAHGVIAVSTEIEPPEIASVEGEVEQVSDAPLFRRLGASYVRERGAILEVRLVGSPEEIGHAHGRLLYDQMVENEGILFEQFEKYVPLPPVRWLITDITRVAYRDVDQGLSPMRQREIAAQARAFSPDPYDGFLPTYHRFVFLQSLYDISLSFEHSPLIGCTSFATSGKGDAPAILARNFDFEAGPIFDEGKAVFLMHEQDAIPYASVAWPGLVGVVSGMNAEGVALAVHGGRAGEAQPDGEPVVHTLRHVLGHARTTTDAIALLKERKPMVSHIVIVSDAAGDAVVVERAPGVEPFVRRSDAGPLPLTNHFEGQLAGAPENQTVRETTSTLARRARLDELLSNETGPISVERAVEILRDKRAAGEGELPLGHRSALDALIATHAVVANSTSRELWVTEGPHLVGRFIRFDLAELLDPAYEPTATVTVEGLAADAILGDGSYEAWVESGAPHGGVE